MRLRCIFAQFDRRRSVAVRRVFPLLIALLGSIARGLSQAPANDNFANAQVLTGQSGRVMGTNINATRELSEPVHPFNPGGKSIWYRWTATSAESIRFDTVGTGFDTLLAVYATNASGVF